MSKADKIIDALYDQALMGVENIGKCFGPDSSKSSLESADMVLKTLRISNGMRSQINKENELQIRMAKIYQPSRRELEPLWRRLTGASGDMKTAAIDGGDSVKSES